MSGQSPQEAAAEQFYNQTSGLKTGIDNEVGMAFGTVTLNGSYKVPAKFNINLLELNAI